MQALKCLLCLVGWVNDWVVDGLTGFGVALGWVGLYEVRLGQGRLG